MIDETYSNPFNKEDYNTKDFHDAASFDPAKPEPFSPTQTSVVEQKPTHIKPSDLPPDQKEALIARNLAKNESTFFPNLVVIATGNGQGKRFEAGQVPQDLKKAIEVLEDIDDLMATYGRDALINRPGFTALGVENKKARDIRNAFEKSTKNPPKKEAHQKDKGRSGLFSRVRSAFSSDLKESTPSDSAGTVVSNDQPLGTVIPLEPLDSNSK